LLLVGQVLEVSRILNLANVLLKLDTVANLHENSVFFGILFKRIKQESSCVNPLSL